MPALHARDLKPYSTALTETAAGDIFRMACVALHHDLPCDNLICHFPICLRCSPGSRIDVMLNSGAIEPEIGEALTFWFSIQDNVKIELSPRE